METRCHSREDERWPLVDALFWIATRSLEYMRSNPATHFDWLESTLLEMRGAWRYMPSGPSAHQAQEMLWEKLTNGEIVGRATCALRTYFQRSHYGNVTNHFDHEEILENIDFPPVYDQALVAQLEFTRKSFVLRVNPSPHPLQDVFWRDITFAGADIMRLWPEHPETIAHKLAKATPWSPPEGFSVALLALLSDEK